MSSPCEKTAMPPMTLSRLSVSTSTRSSVLPGSVSRTYGKNGLMAARRAGKAPGGGATALSGAEMSGLPEK